MVDRLPDIDGLILSPAPEQRIWVIFAYDPDRIRQIKEIPGYRWHPASKRWSVPHTEKTIRRLRDLFEARQIRGPRSKAGKSAQTKLSPEEQRFLEPVDEELRLRGYSPSTRKSYRNHLLRFRRYLQEDPSEVEEVEIRAYLLHLIDERQVSRAYLNQVVSAIKFYGLRVLRRPTAVEDVPRPRRESKLPIVLGRDEVIRIFRALKNPKHRALLMMAYSAGLRVSEVVRLKVADLDSDRGLVRIYRAKGRKDRYVPLSEVALEAVRLYWKTFRPDHWLFPGARTGKHLTTRSVQKVLSRAVREAGVAKQVTVHTLRHSYATHLLEDGTDLRYVQELLGHRRPETTMIYTHVMQKDIRRIRSPLDNINPKD